MRYGDRGPAVAALQRALISRGHSVGAAGADGILGPATWRALEAVAGGPLDRAEPVPPHLLTSVHYEMPPAEPGYYRRRGDLLQHDRRRRAVDLVVLHESVTWTVADCVKVLNRRGLSVHYIVDVDGAVTQHAPETRACRHAGSPYNHRAIAVEVINRYYGEHARDGQLVIDAVWAHKGRYIMPPRDQLEATHELVVEVRARHDLPAIYPSGDGPFSWGRADVGAATVSAHHRWHHADALVPEHYCQLRDLGLGPHTAYDLTLEAASSGRRRTALPTLA